MHTLTDLEVLALLCAALVDASGHGGGNATMAGHVTPIEHDRARDRFEVAGGMGDFPARAILARVHGLPARSAGQEEPLVMSLAWESDLHLHLSIVEGQRVMRSLTKVGLAGRIPDDIEALCAEVLELRSRIAAADEHAEAILRADVGPPSERTDPFIDAAELAEQEALRAAGSL